VRRLIRDEYLGVRVLSSKPTYHKAGNKPHHAMRGLLDMIGANSLTFTSVDADVSIFYFFYSCREFCSVTKAIRSDGAFHA
jgi:hypothetical protein